MKWKHLPRRILVITNLVLALLALIAGTAIWVSPSDFLLPSLVAVGFPLLLLANLIFLAFWLLLWLRPMWISLATILALSPLVSRYAQLSAWQEKAEYPFTFRVLTYNVNLFRLYSWATEPPSQERIALLVDSLQTDALCLQEFFTIDSTFSDSKARSLFPPNAHIHYISRRAGRAYGLATFSRYPIVDSGHFLFAGSLNGAIFTDLNIGFDTIRIYNLHLQSFRLKAKDVALLRAPQSGTPSVWQSTLGLIGRVSSAMKQRAYQVDAIKRHINLSPHPVIVCGDFNDAPLSYTYQTLQERLHDAFIEAGKGFGTTYRQLFPAYRIDYTLYSPRFRALLSTNPEVHLSDHYPVLTVLTMDSIQIPPRHHSIPH